MNLLNRANWILQYGHGGCDNCNKLDNAGSYEPEYIYVTGGTRYCEECHNNDDDQPVTVKPFIPNPEPGEPIIYDDDIIEDAMTEIEIVSQEIPKLIPRKYQREATDAILNALESSPQCNPLADMATGVGKSLVVAMTADECISKRGAKRILMFAPSKELVKQNYLDAKDYNPDLDIGIYCAGLNAKDLSHTITYGTINSLVNASDEQLGKVDVIIIDECHKVNTKNLGMYRTIVNRLREVNPSIRIVGLTATPFRLDGGHLTDPVEGEPLFTRIVYTFGLREGIEEGYLVPLKAFQQTRAFDDSSIAQQNGDFKKSDLQKAWSKPKIEEAVKNLLIALEQDQERTGRRRKHWLAFCCGIQNAKDIAEELTKYGVTAEHISGEMNKTERDDIIERFKAGKITCLTNADILTTGFNAKNCDVVVQFRNTLSTSLYVQMLGRGTRTYFPCGTILSDEWTADQRKEVIANSEKPDCLVLDFTNNTIRHGPVEDANTDPSVKPATVKAKVCKECEALNKWAAKYCYNCGNEFPVKAPEGKECPSCETANMQNAATCVGCGYDFGKHEAVPYDRIRDLLWDKVGRVHVAYHMNAYKPNKPPTLRVEYYNTDDELLATEWRCFDPRSNPRAIKHGKAWWVANGGKKSSVPTDVNEAVTRATTELTFPTFINIELGNSGFMEIRDRRFDKPWEVAKPTPKPEPAKQSKPSIPAYQIDNNDTPATGQFNLL